MDEKLTMAHGNWVQGDRFWDREEDLALFITRIEEGANQILVAQRRMGKTSLLREAARRLDENYVCLFVDLEKSFSAPDAISELSVAVYKNAPTWDKAKNLFANVLSSVEEVNLGEIGVHLRAGLNEGNWKDKGDQLFAILAESSKPVLLLVDEIPLLVNRLLKGHDYKITPERRQATDEFLSWIRDNAQRHQGTVRIVLTGSIGLEPIVRQAGLSATLNTFVSFELKPWDAPTAVRCIDALANQYEVVLEAGAASAMIDKLGCCIPHHVQMFFCHVRDLCVRRNDMNFSVNEVDTVYNEEMLSIRGHAELTHYEERLKMTLGEDRYTFAIDMLTEAAIQNSLSSAAMKAFQSQYSFGDRPSADVQKEIIWTLEHDGYWRLRKDGYVFVSTFIRDWWKARHGFGYTPVEDR